MEVVKMFIDNIDLDVDYKIKKDAELNLLHLVASVREIEYDFKTGGSTYSEVIGEGYFLIANPLHFSNWISMVAEIDGISQETFDVAVLMEEEYEAYGEIDLFSICEHIYIEKSYQNKGYGKAFFKTIMNDLHYLGVGMIALMIDENNIEKLLRFYKQLNFEQIEIKSDSGYVNKLPPIMVNRLNFK